jgi:hypothetical protein
VNWAQLLALALLFVAMKRRYRSADCRL